MTSKKPSKLRRAAAAPTKGAPAAALVPTGLLPELKQLIETSRQTVARGVNAALTLLYWEVGARIHKEILQQKRAEYGEEIVSTLSTQLAAEYGNGFGLRALRRMVQLAEVFPDRDVVATLALQLGWSHFVEILPLKKPFQRDFYAEMCRVEGWSVRQLRQQIDGMLFERTAISKKPAKVIEAQISALRQQDLLTPDLVFRDPYVLDFLGLKDTYSEKDLEAAILREMERFLQEMGTGFAFVARQKRVIIDGQDFYLDLLFFHRRLKRLVLVELKLGAFQAADFGQVTLYLRWLDRHERQPGEESPVALVLCSEAAQERVELLDLESSGISVAEYLTGLPPKDLLQRRFHDAVALAREQLARRNVASDT